jgi:hypothetical protein
MSTNAEALTVTRKRVAQDIMAAAEHDRYIAGWYVTVTQSGLDMSICDKYDCAPSEIKCAIFDTAAKLSLIYLLRYIITAHLTRRGQLRTIAEIVRVRSHALGKTASLAEPIKLCNGILDFMHALRDDISGRDIAFIEHILG